MSESFDKLKALLEEKGDILQEDIESITQAHGALSEQEVFELQSLRIKKSASARKQVTMDEYLEAAKKLDELEEGTAEYAAAEAIVEAFESGA